MNYIFDDQPIIALSSGTNNSALAVIRISGFENISTFQIFFDIDLSILNANRAQFCKIISNGKVLDEIVLTFFKGPSSYNGENILELSVHGNQLNVSRIISLFVDSSLCRYAEAGEFTYRALKNKKLSLSQVEGLDLLLNAKNDLMLDQGLATLSGDLHREFLELHDNFLKLKAAVELSIDFLEDIGEDQSTELLNSSFNKYFNHLSKLYDRTRGDLAVLMSPSIVLVGQTNAGKSSLFNLLLKNNRSIVSSIAGTTRDYVSEFLNINGTNFRLVDTAGIRISDDNIESIGIMRTFEQIKNSFFNILVINPFQTNRDDLANLDMVLDLVVVTHADIENFHMKFEDISDKLPDAPILKVNLSSHDYGPIGPTNHGGPIEPLSLQKLSKEVATAVHKKFNKISSADPILIDRHRRTIGDIYSKSLEFSNILKDEHDIAIVSSELNLIGSSISSLIGIITVNDILASIFSNFCIGK